MGIGEDIKEGQCALGIELGSTRIKAVLVDKENNVLAQGDHTWENSLIDGYWTYSLEEVWAGIQDAYANLAQNVYKDYDIKLTNIGALGISAMMHGYLAFDEAGELLVPFRTWRNTTTAAAAAELSKELKFNMPQRWSISHYYQALLSREPHVSRVSYFTTLAVYVHYMLTGQLVAGIGEASGMFPIDSANLCYDAKMLKKFNEMAAAKGAKKPVEEMLPKILLAGEDAGRLTPQGAALLDPTGALQAGCLMAPPEGDAGTGMVATNAVSAGTGNVSAGTSVFSMVVLDKPLSKPYEEIDMVTTPSGEAVAMVHCNNCTSDLNAWVKLFAEFSETMGMKVDMNELYGTLYRKALEGEQDCGGLLSYNLYAGEPVVGLQEGRPMFLRKPDANFSLANFMRANLYASLGVLKIGNDILLKNENVSIASITGHGGLFKTAGVGQSILAAALNAPISVMSTAGEGGAWGMAVLANFVLNGNGASLGDYLNTAVFGNVSKSTVNPDPAMVAGFDTWIEGFGKGVKIQQTAVEVF